MSRNRKEVDLMELGEMVEVWVGGFREIVTDKGYTLRDVVALMKSYMLNVDYLQKRLKKGSVPINVFKAACKVIDVDFRDYVIEYDLSCVPTYQIQDELKRRNEK